MTRTLYGHPFSSYCQKAIIAFYELEVAFRLRLLSFDDAQAGADFAALWPLKRMPVLDDDGRVLMEASVIVEHVDQTASASRLIPADARAALETRMMDRVFDNYVMTPMQKIVLDALRPPDARDAHGVEEARSLLETAYGWLDVTLAGRAWAAGDAFTLADCAAAPALLYADWAQPIDARFSTLRAFRARLLARPSVARAVDEARPYRSFFPLGAPDRD